MRVRDHIAISTAGAALLYPRAGRAVLLPWAASIFIDTDHYLWFCVRHRRLNPAAAVRLFNEAEAPEHAGTRVLHHPAVLLSVLLLGTRRPWALAIALGMTLHVALDVMHQTRLREARTATLQRDAFTCQRCGTRGEDVVAHVRRQPMMLPSYQTSNLVSLCGSCHRASHARDEES